MNNPESELQAKIRQQFDVVTCPRIPVEKSPQAILTSSPRYVPQFTRYFIRTIV